MKEFEFLEKTVDALKGITQIPASALVSFSAGAAIILFAPENIDSTLEVLEFRNKYRVYLGPSLIACIMLIFAKITLWARIFFESYKALRKIRVYLSRLTPEEKRYLLPFIKDEVNSIYVGVENGVIMGPLSKGIVYMPSRNGDVLNGFAFNLVDEARKYLTSNPACLNDARGRPLIPRERNSI